MGLQLVYNGFESGLKQASKVPNETAKSLQRVCSGSTMGLKGAYKRICNGLQGICNQFALILQEVYNGFAKGLKWAFKVPHEFAMGLQVLQEVCSRFTMDLKGICKGFAMSLQ